MPRFTPSFAQQELRLKPLPSTQIATARKPLFALDMDVLPPLPFPSASETETPRPQLSLMADSVWKRRTNSMLSGGRAAPVTVSAKSTTWLTVMTPLRGPRNDASNG